MMMLYLFIYRGVERSPVQEKSSQATTTKRKLKSFPKPVPEEFVLEVVIKVLQTDRKQRQKLSFAKAVLFQFTKNFTECEDFIEENTNILENDDEYTITAGGVFWLVTQRINDWDVYASGNKNTGIWDVSFF
jgi:hypothetical protein